MNRRGVALIEVIISVAIAGIVMAGVFALARGQARGYRAARESLEMNDDARIVFEKVTRNLRNTGAGTSFFVGIDPTAAIGTLEVVDSLGAGPTGAPALRLANNVVGPGAVLPGTDALHYLRVAKEPGTFMQVRIPAVVALGTPYPVDDFAALAPCLNRDSLLLISDQSAPTSAPAASSFPQARPASNPARHQLVSRR